jgi:integrase
VKTLAKALTAAAIRTMKAPLQQRIEVKDGLSTGLYLVLQPSGHRSFAMRFRGANGKPQKLVLGVFDPGPENDGEPVVGQPLTLAAARRLSTSILRDRAMGRDVLADHRAAKVQRKTAVTDNFAGCVWDFILNHAKAKTRRWQTTARLLGYLPDGTMVRGGLAEKWSDRAVTDIDSHAIYNIVEGSRVHGVPGWRVKTDGPSDSRARQLFSALSTFFGWCHKHRRISSNPCLGVHRPDVGQSRDRVLTANEIQLFWKACSEVGWPFGHVGQLLLLTSCRLNEVAGMARSEIDGDSWVIPASRSKNRKAHTVILSRQAQAILASVPNTGSDLIFSTNGKTAVSGWTHAKKRISARMGVADWRFHDLRRTAATTMAETGIAAPHVISALLNHTPPGVTAIYLRANYAAERKAALQTWADYLDRLGSNVVALRRA